MAYFLDTNQLPFITSLLFCIAVITAIIISMVVCCFGKIEESAGLKELPCRQ